MTATTADKPSALIIARDAAECMRHAMDRAPAAPGAYDDDAWSAGYRHGLAQARIIVATLATRP